MVVDWVLPVGKLGLRSGVAGFVGNEAKLISVILHNLDRATDDQSKWMMMINIPGRLISFLEVTLKENYSPFLKFTEFKIHSAHPG